MAAASNTTATASTPSRERTGDVRARMGRGGPAHPGPIEKARDPRKALVRLLPYLAPFKTALALVAALLMASILLELIGPYLMGIAIDGFIATKDPKGLAFVAVWMLVVYILVGAVDAAAGWRMGRVSQSALKNVRRDLFGHLQTLPLRFFDTRPAGELMSRLTNDIEAINQAVSQNVVALLGGVLLLAGILVAMFVLNVYLALASVVVVPLMFWVTNFVARYTRKGFRDLQRRLGDFNGVMEEALSGQRVVKAFRRNASVVEAFRKHNDEVYRAAVYANSYALLLMPLTNQLGNLFVIVLAGLGGWLALKGLVTVGLIATFISYGRNFINPLRQLANMYNAIQAALAGAERVFEIIDTPSEADDAAAAPLERVEGRVRFEDVDFSYVPGTPVIKHMTLEARPGEILALVGPTGAGKTTIVNLLTRFYEIDGGRISVDGTDIRRIRKDDLRRSIGLVLQDTFLFSASVMDNIRYGRPEASDADVAAAARIAEADHFIRRLSQGYETMLSERAANLSQGQRQLLAIARAVLADPAILILDEATSSVDTRTEARIQKALLRLMEGRTSFVIAHRLSTICEADHLLVIDDGEIVEQGTHRSLLARRGFYHRLYMAQFKGEKI